MWRGWPLVERENRMEAPIYVEEDERTEPDLRDAEQQAAPLQGSTENETVKGGSQPIHEIDSGKQQNLDNGSAVEEMDETVLQLLTEIATQCNVSFNQRTELDLREAEKQPTLEESTDNETVKVGSQPIHRIDCGKQQNFEKGNAAERREESFLQIVDEIATLCNDVSYNQRTAPDLRDNEQQTPPQETTENVETIAVVSQPIHGVGCGEDRNLESEIVAGEMDEEDGLGTVQDEVIVLKRLEEANIQVLREKVDNFSQQISELLNSSKAHVLDALNAFKEEIMQFHQKVLERCEEEIEGLPNANTANEDMLSFHLPQARNVFSVLQVSASPDYL